MAEDDLVEISIDGMIADSDVTELVPMVEWPAWEQRRKRSFYAEGPKWLNNGERMLQGRKSTLDINKYREADDFKATFSFTIELETSNWKLDRDNRVAFVLLQGTTAVFSQIVPGIARRCHNWTTFELSGEFDPAHFEQITNAGFSSGTLQARRC